MSSVSPETMSVCLSSRRYSGVISFWDSISSPDLIIWSNSTELAIPLILQQTSPGRIWVSSRRFSGRAAVAIAQQAEHQIVDLGVAGSNPASHPLILYRHHSDMSPRSKHSLQAGLDTPYCAGAHNNQARTG